MTPLADRLQCPRCGKELHWRGSRAGSDPWDDGRASCAECGGTYPLRDGIGLFIVPEDRSSDPWAESESGLLRFLAAHPDIEHALMESSTERLGPADLYFRSYVHRLRGQWRESIDTKARALPGIYSAEWLAATERLSAQLITRVQERTGPVVDLASGEGTLLMRLARTRPDAIATDISPQVLRGARERIRVGGGKISRALAFDARRTPWRRGAIGALTTFGGLSNIGDPAVLGELRRIVGGTFVAVEWFFDMGDRAHVEAARALGIPMHGRDEWLTAFDAAGWTVTIIDTVAMRARPTPVGVLIPGAVIDGLPARETDAELCLLEAF